MTQAQLDAETCGLVPEDNPPLFVAKHLSAYAFTRSHVKHQRVLEVGFGSGYGTAYLAEAAGEVIGVDLAAGNIPRAQARYPRANVTYLLFDGSRLPFDAGTFDAVGSFQVIEHVPEPQLIAWLTEIRRVLRPGGRFFVSTLNLAHAMKPGRPYQKLPYHEKEFTAPELAALLAQVFPSVTLYGLRPTLRHRCCQRLKRCGITVRRFFDEATVADFVVTRRRVSSSIDLIAVCTTDSR